MSEQDPLSDIQIPEVLIRKKKSFSIIWIIPLIAAMIGGWLVYKSISDKGPVISIVFNTAEGLEAGKTKIKYKNVVIGQVESIVLDEHLTHVVVTAQMDKGTKTYLTTQTRFWVVRARLRAGEVSGLGTLFAGAYIAIDPVQKAPPSKSFIGLEIPPVVSTNKAGRHFILKAEKLGSVDIGSPIFYRQIEVGQVEGYKLDDDGKNISIKIFIDEPHHGYVRNNTRFWNVSGFDVAMDANGLSIDTQSLVSLMIGGLAFDNPILSANNKPAENNDTFKLFNTYKEAVQRESLVKHEWLLVFEGSVRGLTRGAPVEFRGIHVGKVLDVAMQMNTKSAEISISVLIETDPLHFLPANTNFDNGKKKELFDTLVARGLRAQLQSGSLLTGKLFVNLDFYPNQPDRKIIWEGIRPQLPTIPATLEEIFAVFNKLLNRIDKIPFIQISKDLHQTVKNLNIAIQESEKILKKISNEVTPEMTSTLEQAKKSLTVMEKLMRSDSPINQDARRALDELAGAAQSMRILTDYLERHPDSLIYGKGQK